MSHLDRIDIDSPDEKLDGFLHYSLLNYAHVLAELLMESSGGYPIFEMKESKIDNQLKYIKRGRKIDKKYKIASIWGLMMRHRQRIVWPDVIRFYNEKSSSWETTVWSSLWKKISSSADWPNVVGLLDWFHNKLKKTPYGGKLELPYKIIKYEGRVKYLKRRCSLIIKKDVKDAISNFRVFIPEGLPVEIRFIPYSIKFNEKSIEISGIKEKIFFTRKVDFIKDKKFSFDYSIPKQLPSITFPNGEIFKAPTTREMLTSTLACLSGLKFL